VLALLLGAAVAARAQEAEAAPTPAPVDEKLTRILDRTGEAVARYHAELFRIAYTETLRHEELSKEMTPKKSKEYVFDTVVVREELSAEDEDYYPKSVRRLRTIDGKPAKRTKDRRAEVGAGVASLLYLLPKNRHLFQFSLEGEEQVGGRAAHRIRMLRPGEGEARVEWERRLIGARFRVFAPEVVLVWVDAENFDVLRVESHLDAPFEFESPRAFGRFGPSRRLKYVARDYAATFRRERFKDPEQTLLVPVEAEWLNVIEGASKPRTRTTLRFSDYRRYRSDVKVIEETEPGR
jgi:hypothetical protein